MITLALGIGANTAIFSLVNTVLLRALPFKDPEQLVSVGKVAGQGGLPGVAGFQYLAWKEKSNSFDGIAAYTDNNFNLIGQGEPERIPCAQVTASLFTTLGVPAARGPHVSAGRRSSRKQSSRGCQRRLGSVASGATHLSSARLFSLTTKTTSSSVSCRRFRFPGDFEIWLPLALDPVRETQGDFFSLVEVMGRLKPDVMVQQAQTELNLISQHATTQLKDPVTAASLETTHCTSNS